MTTLLERAILEAMGRKPAPIVIRNEAELIAHVANLPPAPPIDIAKLIFDASETPRIWAIRVEHPLPEEVIDVSDSE